MNNSLSSGTERGRTAASTTAGFSQLPTWLVNLVLAVATLGEAALTLADPHPASVGLSFVAAFGLVARHRMPWLSVVLTLPGLVFGCASIAAVVALYTLAVRGTSRWILGAAIGAVFLANTMGSLGASFLTHPVQVLTTAAMFALAPAAVGTLIATRQRLVTSLAELKSAHEEQRRQAATEAIRHEREVLAREMHDVVSASWLCRRGQCR